MKNSGVDEMTLAKGDREFTTEIYNDEIEHVIAICVYLNPDRIVAECHPHYESENRWVFPISKGYERQTIMEIMDSMKAELEEYVNGYGEYADGYEDSIPADEKEDYLLESLNDIIDAMDEDLRRS